MSLEVNVQSQLNITPRQWTIEEFWKMADTTKITSEYQIDKDLEYLETADPDRLKRIFVQYRFFTIYYITDLAMLVARLPFGSLRSNLGLFLAEELGNGNQNHAHPELYDAFLRSVGVPDELFSIPDPRNIAMLENLQKMVMSESPAYAIGLRGMGGECLCQMYLSAMHERFMKNPYIIELKEKMATPFWDIHTGEEDIHHREATRKAISDYLDANPDAIQDLAAGYHHSKIAWDTFWKNIFTEARRTAN